MQRIVCSDVAPGEFGLTASCIHFLPVLSFAAPCRGSGSIGSLTRTKTCLLLPERLEKA